MMTFHSNSNSAPVSKTKRDTDNFACQSRHRCRVGSKRKQNKWNISSTLYLLPLLVMIKLFSRINMLSSDLCKTINMSNLFNFFIRFLIISLFFSVDIMVFDFPHFVFFQVQYIDISLLKTNC